MPLTICKLNGTELRTNNGRGWCEGVPEPETLHSPNGNEGVEGRSLKLRDQSEVSVLSQVIGSSLTLTKKEEKAYKGNLPLPFLSCP